MNPKRIITHEKRENKSMGKKSEQKPSTPSLTPEEIRQKFQTHEKVCFPSVRKYIICDTLENVTPEGFIFSHNAKYYENKDKKCCDGFFETRWREGTKLYDPKILTMPEVILEQNEKARLTILTLHPPQMIPANRMIEQHMKTRSINYEIFLDKNYKYKYKQTPKQKTWNVYKGKNALVYVNLFPKTGITPENYQKIYLEEKDTLENFLMLEKLTPDQCAILMPLSKIKYDKMTISQAIDLAFNKTKENKREVQFHYNPKTREIISPIIMGCDKSISVIPEFIENPEQTKIADFHTHPMGGICSFSNKDLHSMFKQQHAEKLVGCFQQNGNLHTKIAKLKLNDIPKGFIDEFKLAQRNKQYYEQNLKTQPNNEFYKERLNKTNNEINKLHDLINEYREISSPEVLFKRKKIIPHK